MQIWTIVKGFNILVLGILKQVRERIGEILYWGEPAKNFSKPKPIKGKN